MKKLFALLLVLMLFLSSQPTFCEEDRFSVRNGIMFGMTKDEVIDIELSNNSGEYRDAIVPEDLMDKYDVRLIYNPNTVAGLESGKVSYYFTKDNKLGIIQYIWSEEIERGNDKGVIELEERFLDNYIEIDNVLKGKYTKIGGINDDGTVSYIDLKELRVNMLNSEIGQTIAFSQYMGQDGDNKIIIENICYWMWGLNGKDYTLFITYLPLTQEEIDRLKEEKEERNRQEEQRKNEKQEQMNNDL